MPPPTEGPTPEDLANVVPGQFAHERPELITMTTDTMRAIGDKVRAQYRADLRAKVEELPPAGMTPYWIRRADVLALLDGTDQ